MDELGPGLYESLVTEGLKAQLDALADQLPTAQRGLRAAEASDRIAWHLSRQIEGALSDVADDDRVEVGLRVARVLLDRLGELVEVDRASLPVDPATILHAILRTRPDGSTEPIGEPLIPLLDTTLLTSAPGEPNLVNQLRSEIESADEIDLVMAFIRRSGINPLTEALRRHCAARKPLRVLTTTTRARPRAGPSISLRASAPMYASPTTSAPRASMRRRGYSTVARGSRPPTSAHRI